ncbi:NfeD family protein [Actinomarinicola tropica]|uniref:Uncharacterized protein n=1 Tax=Actinomarinicola tropica TaxID=2789776 RepID=A0A5Q2RRS9_9ACTN|nr:NfeD family protein [Actinomarinicola tropica]QGG96857.1 hypothetical protein GH723_18105 [Actinomarinicola tropica]
MTTFFIVVGGLGVGLLVLGLLLDDVLDGLFDVFDSGGALSAPVIGAFLGAFGIGGWLAQRSTSSVLVALVAAGLAGLVLGYLALRLSLAFVDMPTDATPTSGDYLGQIGKVVTPIAAGRGEVMIRMGGTPHKLTARSDSDLARGVEVVVVEVLSPNAVAVVATTDLFEQE